jgi:superfamily I DNA and/or RNA helicase
MSERIRERVKSAYLNLNEEQQEAIDLVLEEPIQGENVILPIIDGPPGTGKTRTATGAAAYYFLQNPKRNKVLYVCPTNVAADVAKKMLEELWGFPPYYVVRLVPKPGMKDWDRGVIGCEWTLEDLSFQDILKLRDVPFIICTPYMLGRMKRISRATRKIIIDEFSQIDAPTFFMILNSSREINPDGVGLFGDPLQLPVVTTQEELRQNVVRHIELIRGINVHSLKKQYRMHKSICSAVNNMRKRISPYIQKDLVPAENVESRGMTELGWKWNPPKDEKIKEILNPSNPLVIYNTDKLGFDDRSPTGSVFNEGEAELAVELAKAAYKSYTKGNENLRPIILSPYTAQVNLIKEKLRGTPLEENVKTVYSAQGNEYPFVIVSFVRNNPKGEIGFLDMPMLEGHGYVAISRAQGKLIVLLSKSTFLSTHPIFEAFEDVQEEGCLKVYW